MGLEHANQLLDEYGHDFFYNVARYLAPNTDVAQEALGRSWLKLIEGKSEMREHYQTKGLMYKIIKCECLKMLKDQRRSVGDSLLETMPAPRAAVDHSELVDAVLTDMSPQRRLLFLKRAEGIRFIDMAEQNDKTSGAYRARAYRARKALREVHSM